MQSYAPTGRRRHRHQAGSEASPILLGDHYVDKDAEFEVPTRFAVAEKVSQKQTVVPMPAGVGCSSRSPGRATHPPVGPQPGTTTMGSAYGPCESTEEAT
ncbi:MULTISPECIES: hypothetical protein [unclassified Gordonia (in: high G+C Gram-positive bacteria)]